MNQFEYKGSFISKSEADFSEVPRSGSIDAECQLAVNMKVPKEPEKNKIVVCALFFSMVHEKTEKPIMHIETKNIFEIIGTAEPETLQKDAEEICLPEAEKVLTEIIEKFSTLHIGKTIHIDLDTEETE